MNRFVLLMLVVFFSFSLSSCLKGNRPPSAMKHVNEGNTRIYGVPGEAPRQSKITYEKLPNEIQRANKVREILYPS